MKDSVYQAALAGLTAGLDFFTRPSGDFANHWTPAGQRAGLAANPYAALARTWLSIGQQSTDMDGRMAAILTRIDLERGPLPQAGYYRLASLSVSDDRVYPVPRQDVGHSSLKAQWNGFEAELQSWKQQAGSKWDSQSPESYYTTLLALMRKHLWCVPSQNESDVSLYGSLRLASALASCLAVDNLTQAPPVGKPAALMLRGDVSGIQAFIYRITQAGAETSHVAKRLRGRSFYLSLLVDVTVDWLLRQLGLPPACALFVGGGRFDLLLPQAAQERLPDLFRELDGWLLNSFQGELSIQTATYPIEANDFGDMRRVYNGLEERLAESKASKWRSQLGNADFHRPDLPLWHVCQVCQLTPLPNPGVCSLCQQHESIGKHLPHAASLVTVYGDGRINLPVEQIIQFTRAPFNIRVAILRKNDQPEQMTQTGLDAAFYQLNETQAFIRPGYPSSFRFLANTAPKARRHLHLGKAPVDAGDVLHFEALAALSTGAQRLGVLKADVDYLGLVMSAGLDTPAAGSRPTMARVAELSNSLDLFFAGLLNQVCEQAYQEWRASESEHAEDVDGLFYILYAGGDDLFITGPWDALLSLAGQLNRAFQKYCGGNPNLTISAGFVQGKARFPVQKYAELVDDAEKEAKEAGRNRISAFEQVMDWEAEEDGFQKLMEFSVELSQAIEARGIPRTLISDLGQIYRQHFTGKRKTSNPMWTPRMYYTMARRLNSAAFARFGQRLILAMRSGKILFPVSVVSLATRKE